MSSVVSVTSRVVEYLERQPIGYQFKTTDLLNILNSDTSFSGQVGIGAVSGVMSRASQLGLISRELEPPDPDRKHRPGYIYTLTSRFEMDVRPWAGAGGAKGRVWNSTLFRSRLQTCVRSIKEEGQLIARLPIEGKRSLDQLRVALQEFSDDDLWAELERRTAPTENPYASEENHDGSSMA